MSVGQDRFTSELVRRLEGMSLREAAELLNMTEATVSRLRSEDPSKRRRAGQKVIRNALKRWPDLLYHLNEREPVEKAPAAEKAGSAA